MCELLWIFEYGFGVGMWCAIVGLLMGGFGVMDYAVRSLYMFVVVVSFFGVLCLSGSVDVWFGLFVSYVDDPYDIWGDL